MRGTYGVGGQDVKDGGEGELQDCRWTTKFCEGGPRCLRLSVKKNFLSDVGQKCVTGLESRYLTL